MEEDTLPDEMMDLCSINGNLFPGNISPPLGLCLVEKTPWRRPQHPRLSLEATCILAGRLPLNQETDVAEF